MLDAVYGVNPVSRPCAPGASASCASPARPRSRARGRDLALAGVRVEGVTAMISIAPRGAACTRASSADVDEAVTSACRNWWPRAGPPLIVVLDGIEDPHNLGAILRTVDAVGADGVVRQTRHAARLDGAAAKASAGAVAHVHVAERREHRAGNR